MEHFGTNAFACHLRSSALSSCFCPDTLWFISLVLKAWISAAALLDHTGRDTCVRWGEFAMRRTKAKWAACPLLLPLEPCITHWEDRPVLCTVSWLTWAWSVPATTLLQLCWWLLIFAETFGGACCKITSNSFALGKLFHQCRVVSECYFLTCARSNALPRFFSNGGDERLVSPVSRLSDWRCLSVVLVRATQALWHLNNGTCI